MNQFQKFIKQFFVLLVEVPLVGTAMVLVFYLVFTASTDLRLVRETERQSEKALKGMVNSYAVVTLQDGSLRFVPDWRTPIPIADNGGVCKPSTAWIVRSWDNEITIPFTHALSITPCTGVPPEGMKPFLYVPPVHVKHPHSIVSPPPAPAKQSISAPQKSVSQP